MAKHELINIKSLTLDGAVNDSATTFNVNESTTGIPVPSYFAIESEIVEVTGVGPTSLTVARAAQGTVAAAHADLTEGRFNMTAANLNEVIADLVAAESDIDDNATAISDHEGLVTGNPHAVTKGEVGLGNVANTDLTGQVNANTAAIANFSSSPIAFALGGANVAATSQKPTMKGHNSSTAPLAMLRDGQVVGISLTMTKVVTGGSIDAQVFIGGVLQVGYTVQVTSGDSGFIEFGTPLTYSAGDQLDVETITVSLVPATGQYPTIALYCEDT